MQKAPRSQMIFCAWLILAQFALVSTPGHSDPLADRGSQLAFPRGAKEIIVIDGSTLRLQASIWRNFMPVIYDANSTYRECGLTDLIVMPRLLIMAESSAKACPARSTTQAAALLPTILFALFATL